MLGFSLLNKTLSSTEDTSSTVLPLTLDQLALHRINGFLLYRGEDILHFPQIDKLVQEIKAAFGGDFKDFDEHILPSLRVFATYVQFLPASSKTDNDSPASTNGHHTEPLGLLIHSLQTALIALNICRNINFNFGVAPDKRAKYTRAYMIASAIGGLTHDLGKICDYEITTTVTDSTGKSQDCRYVFISSLPEFVAKKHGLKLKDVYFQPDNKDKIYLSTVAKLPRYEIKGAYKGRFSKHELISNQKMLLFIKPETEAFIAETSAELYEDFTTFVFQKQLNTNYRFSNKLTSIIHAADVASAKDWIRQHYSKALTPDDYQDTVNDISDGNTVSADSEIKENSDDAILTAYEPQQCEVEDEDDLITAQINEYLQKATGADNKESETDREKRADVAGLELETFTKLGTVPEFEESMTVSVRDTLTNAIKSRINRAQWLINDEEGHHNGVIFTWGCQTEGHNRDKETTFFIRCDNSVRDLLIQLIDEVADELRFDLWSWSDKTAAQTGTNLKTLKNIARILFACGLCTRANSQTGLVLIRPAVTKKNRSLDKTDGFWALLVNSKAVILDKDSEIYREWGAYYNHAGCSFKYTEQLPEGLKENNDGSTIPQNEDSLCTKASDSDEAMLDDTDFITADSLLLRFSRHSLLHDKNTEEKNSSCSALTSLAPLKSSIKTRSDREIEADHALNIQEFAEETRAREYLQMLNMLAPPYVLTRDDYLRYTALDDDEKAQEIEKQWNILREKFKEPDEHFEKLQKEIALTARGAGTTMYRLVSIDGSNFYAAFMWNEETGGQDAHGKMRFNWLKRHGFFPLIRQEHHDHNWHELYYFGCVMMQREIAVILACSGCAITKIAMKDKPFTKVEGKPPKIKDLLRFFEYQALSNPAGSKLFDKFEVTGSAFNVVKVDYQALLYLAELYELDVGVRSINNQLIFKQDDVPPYIWRYQDGNKRNMLAISFFTTKKDNESGH